MDTNDYISIVRVSKPKDGWGNKDIRAKANLPFRIYKRTFNTGPFELDVDIPTSKSSVKFVLFYKLDDLTGGTAETCGG